MSIAYLIANSGTITVYLSGKVYSVNSDHPNYSQIKAKLSAKQEEGLADLINVAEKLSRQFDSNSQMAGKVTVEAGQVLFNGEALHNTAVDKILLFARERFDFAPMVKFLENLMQNPSKKSVDNLYRFLEVNQHPITEDGCFLAYKRVDDNYMDIYRHKFDNSVGKTVSMPRWQVEDDPTVTCAPGLHVASLKYARDDYSTTGRLVICKVNPMDVVSVPTDYNNAKMRVCQYEVIQDYTHELTQEEFVGRLPEPPDMASSVEDEDEDDFDDDECDYCYNSLDDCTCGFDEDEDDDDEDEDDEE